MLINYDFIFDGQQIDIPKRTAASCIPQSNFGQSRCTFLLEIPEEGDCILFRCGSPLEREGTNLPTSFGFWTIQLTRPLDNCI